MNTYMQPIETYRHYICHIALENYLDYSRLVELHERKNNHEEAHKFKEFRYFLNTIESLNNILEYYYNENKHLLSYSSTTLFKKALYEKYSVLSDIAQLKDIYRSPLNTATSPKKGDYLDNSSSGTCQALALHHSTLTKAYNFWLNYLLSDSEINFLEV